MITIWFIFMKIKKKIILNIYNKMKIDMNYINNFNKNNKMNIKLSLLGIKRKIIRLIGVH